MSNRCPTCGAKIKKPIPVRITRDNDRAEWAAWIKHWADAQQGWFIRYWQKKGYADVPTRFPPGYLPLEAPQATATEGASSHD